MKRRKGIMMFCLYWVDEEGPKAKLIEKIDHALKDCEEKRKLGYHFVTLCSEDPNSVGKPGVDVTGPDYKWLKRRTEELRNTSAKQV